jgi:predicted lactoylglutathione lyase
MFDHIGINVHDVPASKAFYTLLLAPLGYTCNFSRPEFNLYAFGPRFKPQFWLMPGRDETRHSGPVHIAFSAGSRAEVDAFHAAGVKAGGKCNGPPGVRGEYHRFYYGAFITDLDGHNVECVCHWPPALLRMVSWPAIAGYVGGFRPICVLIEGVIVGGVWQYWR